MSEHVFDVLTRLSSAWTSRRAYARTLAALVLGGALGSSVHLDSVGAKKGKKRRKKNHKKSNQSNSQPLSCTPNCTGRACGDDSCGGSCGACGAGQLCVQGHCVTGQGTCPKGNDICNGYTSDCGSGNSEFECFCVTSMANETRCAFFRGLHNGNDICSNDAQCAVLFPDIPGVFCMKDTGDGCTAGGVCYAPCPA